MQYTTLVFGVIVASILFLSRVSARTAVCKEPGCVAVDVYYETLCPDSMRFINNQLVPSYAGLRSHLDINFIPYGKARHNRDEAGKWTFTCQHGPSECRGNKGQACGLQAIKAAEKPEKQDYLAVNFVGCVMSATRPATAVQRCAEIVGLSEKTQTLLTECSSSQDGDDLLVVHGDRTHSLQPKLSFVPTIVIDDQYSADNQHQALSNFKGLICGALTNENKPSACSQ